MEQYQPRNCLFSSIKEILKSEIAYAQNTPSDNAVCAKTVIVICGIVIKTLCCIRFISFSIDFHLLSYNRIIVTPLKHRVSRTIKLCGVVFAWAIAIGTSLPYILTLRYHNIEGEPFCLEDIFVITLKHKVYYDITITVIGSVLPIAIVTVLYALCIRQFRESRFNQLSNDSMKRRLIQSKRVIKMFILISLLFCFFTLPHAVFYPTSNFLLLYERDSINFKLFWTLHYSLFAISNINSCINPFVYAKRQPEMKAFVKMALNKFFC